MLYSGQAFAINATERLKMKKLKLMKIADAFEEATGNRPHPTSCWRWATQGAGGIVLKTYLLGGQRMTTPEDVLTWIERRSAKPEQDEPSPTRKALDAELAR